MRPANQQQAVQQMDHLLKRRIKGSRSKGIEHQKRARYIARVLWARYQVGPHQYQSKHIDWYMTVYLSAYSRYARYRHILTLRLIDTALGSKWLP